MICLLLWFLVLLAVDFLLKERKGKEKMKRMDEGRKEGKREGKWTNNFFFNLILLFTDFYFFH